MENHCPVSVGCHKNSAKKNHPLKDDIANKAICCYT
jgi:hypothetical protein